jgi:hypothetical protein
MGCLGRWKYFKPHKSGRYIAFFSIGRNKLVEIYLDICSTLFGFHLCLGANTIIEKWISSELESIEILSEPKDLLVVFKFKLSSIENAIGIMRNPIS